MRALFDTKWRNYSPPVIIKPVLAEYMVVYSSFEQTKYSRPSMNFPPGTSGRYDYDPNDPNKNGEENDRWLKSLPDTWDTGGSNTAEQNHVVLYKPLQMFWYEQLKIVDPGHVDQYGKVDEEYYGTEWSSLTKSDKYITNRAGSDLLASYPTKQNLDQKPMQYFTLVTGHTILKKKGPPKYVYGSWKYPFWVINAEASLEGMTYAEEPFRWFTQGNSVRVPKLNLAGQWLNKKAEYYENGLQRFGQFSNKAITPLFMPGTDEGLIDVAYARVLEIGEPLPRVFNM